MDKHACLKYLQILEVFMNVFKHTKISVYLNRNMSLGKASRCSELITLKTLGQALSFFNSGSTPLGITHMLLTLLNGPAQHRGDWPH